MKIVHFSDPHGGGGAEDFLAYFDKRWVGVFNYTFRRRFKHDLARLGRAVDYILDTKPDVAVCTGDLTSTGQPGEFQRVLEYLKVLRDSKIPLIYLPGNHDCYVRRPKCVSAMRDAVAYLNQGAFVFDDLPVVRRYGDAQFLLVNTSRPSNLLCSWGFLSRGDTEFLERECAKPKLGPRILVAHYPLIEHHPILRTRHRLFGGKEALSLLRSGAIDLSLCGHVHRPYLEIDSTGRGEECAGSVTRNGTIREILWDGAEFHYRTIDL
ncbi:MAG: metallophosphoesterase [Victivallaceae bacterium]|nr:metallophosphoesterase [Victivallaceae bacterium]